MNRILIAASILWTMTAGTLAAQTAAPAANTGAIKLTAGIDFPSVYYFRGIKQEIEPKVTVWPYGDVGITLASSDKGLKSVAVNVGVWNSLHTGTSGSGKFDGAPIHYEEDFYSTLTLGFSPASVAVKYIAYTSPNASYNTVKEVDLQLTSTHKYAPYGLVAVEVNETKGTRVVGADSGQHKGTYLELGAGPNWQMGKATLAVPLSVGLSLKDYYEVNGEDNRFGFFDVGGMLTYPFSGASAKFGAWNVHGRVDYLRLGDATMAIGVGTGSTKDKVVVTGGIGLSY